MTKKGDQAFRVESSNQKWSEMTYGGAVSFLRRRYSRDLSNADIVISGLPYDAATTNRPGARFGPRAIREASTQLAELKSFPFGFEVTEVFQIIDWGDCFIFEQSRCLLIGKPKIGKSHWLGAFASAATTGTEFMGTQFSRPLKVMWLQAEIIHEFLKKRIEMYYKPFHHDPELYNLGKSNPIASGRLRKNIMRDKDINAIAESIDYHQPDIVMIDPIINFFDGEENSNQEIHSLLSRIDRLIELFGVAVIIAHHTGKERADDASFMSARGGSAFAGWMDSGIKLMGQRPNVTMFYEARNAREPETHLARFDFEKGFWDTVDFDQGPDEVEIAQKVADAMDRTKFYTRQDLEILAREALKANNLPSGERAARYAVSHVQKYLGDVVKTKAIPGKQTWHYRFDNQGRKPWED